MSNLVTFEQEQMLERMGFSFKKRIVDCVDDLGRWCKDEKNVSPTVSDALDWVREEKGIECGVYPIMIPIRDGLKRMAYAHSAFDLNNNCKRLQLDISLVKIDTHNLASSALLDAVLTYLEQKEKK